MLDKRKTTIVAIAAIATLVFIVSIGTILDNNKNNSTINFNIKEDELFFKYEPNKGENQKYIEQQVLYNFNNLQKGNDLIEEFDSVESIEEGIKFVLKDNKGDFLTIVTDNFYNILKIEINNPKKFYYIKSVYPYLEINKLKDLYEYNSFNILNENPLEIEINKE